VRSLARAVELLGRNYYDRLTMLLHNALRPLRPYTAKQFAESCLGFMQLPDALLCTHMYRLIRLV
jgi:hypothetical protein